MIATATQAAKVASTLKAEVAALLTARTVAEVVREEINAIDIRILSEGTYTSQYSGERINDPSKSWTMSDEQATGYYAKRAEAIAAAGYDVPEDHCPALVAEHNQTKAEWALIEAAEGLFPGVTNDKLLCGTKEMDGLETRQKWLDLLVGLTVNAPKAA